jgi:hypothetical protein
MIVNSPGRPIRLAVNSVLTELAEMITHRNRISNSDVLPIPTSVELWVRMTECSISVWTSKAGQKSEIRER